MKEREPRRKCFNDTVQTFDLGLLSISMLQYLAICCSVLQCIAEDPVTSVQLLWQSRNIFENRIAAIQSCVMFCLSHALL